MLEGLLKVIQSVRSGPRSVFWKGRSKKKKKKRRKLLVIPNLGRGKKGEPGKRRKKNGHKAGNIPE